MKGDTPAVGAPAGFGTRGYVSLFRLDSGRLERPITVAGPQPVDLFGFSVALGSDTLLVGAPFARPFIELGHHFGDDAPTVGDSAGAVYAYRCGASGAWSRERCRLVSPRPEVCSAFGHAVAAGDGYFVVGAPFRTYGTTTPGRAPSIAGASTSTRRTRCCEGWTRTPEDGEPLRALRR